MLSSYHVLGMVDEQKETSEDEEEIEAMLNDDHFMMM